MNQNCNYIIKISQFGKLTVVPLNLMLPETNSSEASGAARHTILPISFPNSLKSSLTLILTFTCTAFRQALFEKLPVMLSETSTE